MLSKSIFLSSHPRTGTKMSLKGREAGAALTGGLAVVGVVPVDSSGLDSGVISLTGSDESSTYH